VAIIGASGAVISATIIGILNLLASKRSKKEHRESAIEVNNYWVVINDKERSSSEQELLEHIQSLISEQGKGIAARSSQEETEPSQIIRQPEQ